MKKIVPSNFTIRHAELSDVPAIARIKVESWQNTFVNILPVDFLSNMNPKTEEKKWIHLMANEAHPNNRGHFFVAMNPQGQAIGFIVGGMIRMPQIKAYEAEIYCWFLDQHFHNTGIGKQLFLASQAKFKEDNFKNVMGWVFAENVRVNFLVACVFKGTLCSKKIMEFGGKKVHLNGYGWNNPILNLCDS